MDKMNIGKDIPWDEIIARLKRTSTPVQETRLEDWLASDSNARIYRELTGLWEGISEQAAYEPDIEKGWHELSARTIGATAKKEAEPRLPAVPGDCSAGPLLLPPPSASSQAGTCCRNSQAGPLRKRNCAYSSTPRSAGSPKFCCPTEPESSCATTRRSR